MFRLIFTHSLSLQTLHKDYPPCVFDANKLFVLEACQNILRSVTGEETIAEQQNYIIVSKFVPPSDLEALWQRHVGFDDKTQDQEEESNEAEGFGDYGVIASATRFEYGRDAETTTDHVPARHSRHWYVNFADPSLFVAYGGGLFAQDEIQVAEHPDLGCVREALKHLSTIDSKFAPRTFSGGPTPITVENVRRACAFDTGIVYGNAFQRAPRSTIERAMTLLDPPTTTSFICMAAVRPRIGAYTTEDIESLFLTAVTAFAGACSRSDRMNIVHTGNWGCGAFGGNKRLVAAIQVASARINGIELHYHCFDGPSLREFHRGLSLLDEWRRQIAWKEQTLQSLVTFLVAKELQWGVSDGN